MNCLNFRSISSFIPILLLLIHPSNQLVCPPNNQISPCTCSFHSGSPTDLNLGCVISPTQKSLEKLFHYIRQFNDLPSSSKLFIRYFGILQTNLQTLDLTPLSNIHFQSLSISQNNQLQQILSPPKGILGPLYNNSARFQVTNLFIQENPLLEDDSIGNILKYISPANKLEGLWLNGNRLKGSEDGFEFLPGLFTFKSLRYLFLDKNQIKKVGGGQFKELLNMSTLSLAGNGLKKLDKDAFLLNEPRTSTTLKITLDDNQLSDQQLSPNVFSGKMDTLKFISLKGNQFEYISDEKFKSDFFPQGPILELDLTGNPFLCDEKGLWIREDKNKLESRIKGANCANDKGKNIFTTDIDLRNDNEV